jgi:signal transduction histidine kinase/ActR/RegA family two-component response regulator
MEQSSSRRAWRDALLRRLLFAVVPLIALALVSVLLGTHGQQRLIFGITMAPLVAFIVVQAFHPSWSYNLRAVSFIGTMIVATFVSYALVGFLGGSALVGAVAIISSGLLYGRKGMVAVVLVETLAPVLAAIGMISGRLAPPAPADVSLVLASPWLRTSFVAVTIWLLLGLAITYVVHHIESAVERERRALVDLGGEQVRREAAEDKTSEVERAAMQAQKLEIVGQLATGVAHDFNNVLAVVEGWGELALGAGSSPEVRREAHEALQVATRQGAALARQLLALARRHTRMVNLLRLEEIVDDTMKALRRVLPEDVRVTIDQGDGARLVADETELQQLVFNLVINARDAMPRGGTLCISTGVETFAVPQADARPPLASGRWAFLRVEDSGEGIAPEHQDRIFEPFFTTKPVGVGTGLGLSTVLGIARDGGGGVRVESAPGRGSRFTIYLPEAGPDARPAAARAVHATVRGLPGRLLVLEDHEQVRQLMYTVLTRAGHQVVLAADGDRAVDELRKAGARFDLLCADAVVPAMPAREVIAAFEAAHPTAPVLVVSGYVQEELTRRGIEQGRYRLLRKPFKPEQLTELVEELLAIRRSGDAPGLAIQPG